METKLLPLETAAKLYGMKPRTLRAACLKGEVEVNDVKREFKAVKVGRLWFISPREMQRHFLA